MGEMVTPAAAAAAIACVAARLAASASAARAAAALLAAFDVPRATRRSSALADSTSAGESMLVAAPSAIASRGSSGLASGLGGGHTAVTLFTFEGERFSIGAEDVRSLLAESAAANAAALSCATEGDAPSSSPSPLLPAAEALATLGEMNGPRALARAAAWLANVPGLGTLPPAVSGALGGALATTRAVERSADDGVATGADCSIRAASSACSCAT